MRSAFVQIYQKKPDYKQNGNLKLWLENYKRFFKTGRKREENVVGMFSFYFRWAYPDKEWDDRKTIVKLKLCNVGVVKDSGICGLRFLGCRLNPEQKMQCLILTGFITKGTSDKHGTFWTYNLWNLITRINQCLEDIHSIIHKKLPGTTNFHANWKLKVSWIFRAFSG